MEKGLFSIIVLHYNQPDYYQIALDSVFAQNYDNIQLIFADDCSTRINKEEIKEYVLKNKGENIVETTFLFGEENIGTVKNLNKALEAVKGEYLTFFAADDALFDENTISRYVKQFELGGSERGIVSSQCFMYDEELEEELSKFVEPEFGEKNNQMTSEQQFCEMAQHCRFAIGATAFRVTVFEKYGKFDEQYKYVEDWSYWLRYLRNGGKIYFSNFGGLKHRDGGISHHTKDTLPLHVKQYMLDMLRIRENEVLPYLKKFPYRVQQEIMHIYDWERIQYAKKVGSSERPTRFKIYTYSPALFFYARIEKVLKDILAIDTLRLFKNIIVQFAIWFGFVISNVFLKGVKLTDSLADTLIREIVYVCAQWICPIIVLFTVVWIGCVIAAKLLYFLRNIKRTYFTKSI